MADQIFADGPVDAPAKYEVPGSAEIIPIAVQAVLDGTGAAGDFVPALIFRSQAGHVIARAPIDSTIAAGASAEVSWFPGVKRGGGGSGLATAWCLAGRGTYFGDAGETIANNTITQQTFLHFITSDTTVFESQPGGVSGDNAIGLLQPGVYIVRGTSNWGAGPYAVQSHIGWSNDPLDEHLFTPADSPTATSATVDSFSNFSTQDMDVFVLSGAASVTLINRQVSGGNKTQNWGLLSALYFAMDPNGTRIYG